MTFIEYIVAGLGLLSAATWLYMALGRSGFWKTDIRLARTQQLDSWPRIAVIVPARNEAEVIPSTLPSLLAQDYAGELQVFLVDDSSSDGTGEIAAEIAQSSGATSRLAVVSAKSLAEGWAGKVWAMQQGFEAAETFAPDYLLLTDADIAHSADTASRLVSNAVTEDFATVSVMARLRTGTGWEKLLIPAFVYFFSMLYPFRRVADRTNKTAAAAGGCLLVRRSSLVDAGGFEAIRNRLIDDCSLAAAVSDAGGATWLGYSDGVESVRGYGGIGEIWRMVSRSAYEQLRYSPLLAVGTVVGLGMVFGAPALSAVTGTALVVVGWPGNAATWIGLASGVAALLLMALTYAPVLRMYELPCWRRLTLPVAAVLYLAMTLDSALRHHFGRGVAWKGRQPTTGR